MYFYFIFTFTIIIQLLAAFLSWRLVWIARLKPAWGLIAIALSLIVVRQSLFFFYRVVYNYPFDPTIELLTLTISVLILIGVARIGPFFIIASHLEEAHRESEERFRTVAESASDAIIVTDGAGKIISWNKSAQTIFGYEAKEVMGRPLTVLLPEKFQVAHPTELRPRPSGPDSERNGSAVELVGLKRDGSEFPLELSLSDWRTKEGTFYGALIRDITQRKWAETILRRQLDFEQVLIDTIPFPVFYKDADGLLIGCNKAYEEFFGWPKESVIGKSVYELFPENIADKYFEMDRQLFENLGNQMYEFVTLDSSENLHDIILHQASFAGHGGSVGGIVGAFLDITERKQAEEALRQSERQYRLLVNNIPAVVFKGYKDGSIEFFDNKIEKLAGYSKENFDAKKITWCQLMVPEDLPAYKQALGEALGNNTPFISEFRIMNKSGEILWVQARGQKIDDQPGQADSFSGVFFDVSDRKRFEAERLMFSKIESLGLLAGGIAHDFNNILTAILGNISLVMMKLPQESQIRDRLQRSEKACLQAQSLAQQLLTFAKGGAPVKTLIPLSELVHESAIFACRGSQARCEFSLDKDLWAIEADPGQVGQVFNNLLINAIQAMPTGGTINISAQNLPPEAISDAPLNPGRYVKISIQDQGIGIPAEDLANIFDPYYTTKQTGSGLGLATAYSIIKNHNGHISVVSKLGSGTTFHIYLPASDRLIAPQREIVGEALAGKGKVLVMDDEPVVREVLGEMLRDLGYEGYFARDGVEAIKQFVEVRENGEDFAAVILDLTVPGGMGGKEALGHLLRLAPKLKAIVSSGYSDDPIMADFKKYGFSGVISKPYRVSDLSRILYEVIMQS
jgi:PAS domain S-box-containing protein